MAQRESFLVAYASVGVITAAAKLAGIDRQRHYEWLEKDIDGYKARFEDAHAQACDRLVTEAVRRGVQGWDEPVFGRGEGAFAGTQQVGVIRKYSDTMLGLLLKAKVHEFRDRRALEHTGKGGGPIETVSHPVIDITKLTDEQLDVLEQIGLLAMLAPQAAAPTHP